MAEVYETRIKVGKKQISFLVGTVGKEPVPFPKDKFNLEFSIARIFHRVLNVYRLIDQQIFEMNDYKILGNSLSKILFENEISDQNKKALDSLMRTFRNTHLDSDVRCRIYLEFQPDAGDVAMLPWEYLRLRLEIQDKGEFPIYLAADEDAKFDLIRSFPVYENFKAPAPVQTLHVVVVTSNSEGPFNIDKDRKFEDWCADLKNRNATAIEFHELKQPLDQVDKDTNEHSFTARLKELVKTFDGPYILHYFGHSQVKEGVGSLSFVGENGKAAWVIDQQFAKLFNSKNLRKPHVVILQACSSGQIAAFKEVEGDEEKNEIRGVAINLVMNEIPAVVAMQNDVTEADSLAFLTQMYQSLIEGDDIAEAVTKGRTYLGWAYEGSKQSHHSNNIFGTPVLFLSASQPFSLRERKKAKGSGSEPGKFPYKYCMICQEPFENTPGNPHENHKVISINEEDYRKEIKEREAAAGKAETISSASSYTEQKKETATAAGKKPAPPN